LEGVWAGALEDSVEAAGEVAFEAASDLAWCFAFGCSSGGVVLGFGVVGEAGERDRV
jgi:hypothetical protein